jgi:hypothetical protein
MTYPDDKRKIAVKLLLPPVSLDVSRVADALEVPYQTIRNWKIKAEAGQVIDNRLRKSIKTTTALHRSPRTKIESQTIAPMGTRKCTSSNAQSHESSKEKCTYSKTIRLSEDYKN